MKMGMRGGEQHALNSHHAGSSKPSFLLFLLSPAGGQRRHTCVPKRTCCVTQQLPS